ncbi:MAG: hypothetical protein JW782_00605 [Candidatus Saganbacteria bacterium]|nr:hypothetical protein [Candidatus Saganbacteria bacterium]
MAMSKPGTFQDTAFKTYLPSDKLSSTFKNTLQVVDGLEDTFYAAEKAANTVADAAEDVWDEVSSWFS